MKLAVKPPFGRGYVASGLYVATITQGNQETTTIQRAVELTSFSNDTLGDLSGNWVSIPKNLDGGQSTKYPEQLVDSESLTLGFNGSGKANSARKVPYTAKVLRPSESQENVGDITGRQYEVHRNIYADIV